MIPMPKEADFFATLNVLCWPPERRTERRLRQFLADEATAPSHSLIA
jgi:hypothetical protein